ncbi:MAG: Acetyl esterase/lipase [Microbacteriaceae bacterium]|jgi:acetyl esterase|nr:Acetyl esterase/lipase [Microbacteriaceae bacterium]
MKPVLGVSPCLRMLTALAAGTMLLALAACAPTATHSELVTSTNKPIYPQVKTYPSIDVSADVSYGADAGTPLLLDVCLPTKTASTGARPAVLSLHGGSWRAGDKSSITWRSVCQWLASEGFVTFSVGYRLAPQHPFPAGFDDVRAAVRWMREPANADRYDIDPDRIGVFGGSAGGNLAALLGTEGSGDWTSGSRVAAVAELSGPIDLTGNGVKLGNVAPDFQKVELDYLGCASFSICPQAEKASPLYQVDDSDPPFFIAHSLKELIPLQQSEAMVQVLRAHDVDTTFVTVKGTLHSVAMLDDDMRSRIVGFLHAKLDAR